LLENFLIKYNAYKYNAYKFYTERSYQASKIFINHVLLTCVLSAWS